MKKKRRMVRGLEKLQKGETVGVHRTSSKMSSGNDGKYYSRLIHHKDTKESLDDLILILADVQTKSPRMRV